jgi:hypothetical protein
MSGDTGVDRWKLVILRTSKPLYTFKLDFGEEE